MSGREALGPKLAEWLSNQEGRAVEVRGLELVSAGARRLNALFEVARDGEVERLALTMIPTAAIQILDVTGEAAVRDAAEAAGVPVPHVHYVCTDDSVLGGPFFPLPGIVSEKIHLLAGEVSRPGGEGSYDAPHAGDGSPLEEGAVLCWRELGAAIAACDAGEIEDGKTELALRRLAARL